MHGEPIAVTGNGEGPAMFTWREQRYTVLRVVEHWVISRDWWQRNDLDARVLPEREFWQVEAITEGDTLRSVYELRHDVQAGNWLLVQIWD
jgi:hypothetical protein